MQLFYQRFNIQEYLLFTLLGLTGIVLISNFFGPTNAEVVTNWLGILLSCIVMFLSVVMVSKYGLKGNHGKAWILFMLFSAYWFCAESVDVLYETILGTQPWEYADDFFYITGYQLFFASLVFYLRPFSKQISKKIILGTSAVSIALLLPMAITVFQNNESVNSDFLILLSYTVLDSIILIPALMGVFLFFRGGVNFMVSLLCLGIISQIIADNSILFLAFQGTYYPGHLADSLLLWTYAMFAYGLFNQIRLFDEKSENNVFSSNSKPEIGQS